MNEPQIDIELKTGKYNRGEQYPEYDFSVAEKHGVYNKGGVVACTNKQLKEQIDDLLNKTQDTQVTYIYYDVKEK